MKVENFFMADDNQTIVEDAPTEADSEKSVPSGKLPIIIPGKRSVSGSGVLINYVLLDGRSIADRPVSEVKAGSNIEIKGENLNVFDSVDFRFLNQPWAPLNVEFSPDIISFSVGNYDKLLSSGGRMEMEFISLDRPEFSCRLPNRLNYKTQAQEDEAKKAAKAAQEKAERINEENSQGLGSMLNVTAGLSGMASASTGGASGSALLTQFKNALASDDRSKLESLAKEASSQGNVKILEEVLKHVQNQQHKDVLLKHVRLAKNVELKTKEQVKIQSNKTFGGKVSIEAQSDEEDGSVEAAENISGDVSVETSGQVRESGSVNVSTSGTVSATADVKTEVSGTTTKGTQSVNVTTSSGGSGGVATSEANVTASSGGVSTSGEVTKEASVSQSTSSGGSVEQTVTPSSQGSQQASVAAQVSAGAGGQVSASGSASAEEQMQVSGQTSISASESGSAQENINAQVLAQGSLNTNEEQEVLAQSKILAEAQQEPDPEAEGLQTEQGVGNINSDAGLQTNIKLEENLQVQSQLKQNQSAQESNTLDQEPLEAEAENDEVEPGNNKQQTEAVLSQKNVAEEPKAKVSGNVASKENESGDTKENQQEKIAPSKAGLEILERLNKGPSGLNKDLERVNMRAAGDERSPQTKGQTSQQRSKSAGRGAGGGAKVNTPLGGSLNRPESNLDSEGGKNALGQLGKNRGQEERGLDGEPSGVRQENVDEREPGQAPNANQKQKGQKPTEQTPKEEPQEQENPETETALPQQVPTGVTGGVAKEAVAEVAKTAIKNLGKQGLVIIMPYVLWSLGFFIGILVVTAVIVGIAYAGCTKYPVFKLTYPTVCETLENIGKATNSSSNAQSTSSSAPAPSPIPTTGGVNPR